MADVKMPLTEHLEELRWRIIRSLLAVGAAFAGCYSFAEFFFALLTRPLLAYHASTATLIGTGVGEAFFTKLKVSFIAALFIASPVLLYQTWQFVAPGLFEREKRYARPFVVFGTLFFVAGAVFCYEVVFPVAFAFFLAEYGTINVEPTLRIAEYLSFSSRMLLAFGVTFELPVLTFFLARVGLVDHRTLIYYGRYAILGTFVLAAVLTPPDVVSQFLMAGPLLLLYGISILVAYVFARRKTASANQESGAGKSGNDGT